MAEHGQGRDDLAFGHVAARVDAALAALPAGADPYEPARALVEDLVGARAPAEPPELMWSFWLDAMRLDDALAALAVLPGLPAGSVAARLLAGIAADASRTTAAARAEAYVHAYGLRRDGATAPSALRQARVPSALATLLRRAARVHQADDTDVIADGLPLLHALADLANLLNEAVHPALDELTRAARRDGLVALYALARPELRPLLPVRRHVVLPEPWMPAVDAIAALGRWPQVSAVFFAQLAETTERILLSVRLGGWPATTDAERAITWARFWRADLQIHGLARAVVD